MGENLSQEAGSKIIEPKASGTIRFAERIKDLEQSMPPTTSRDHDDCRTDYALLEMLRDVTADEPWRRFLQIYEPMILAHCRAWGLPQAICDDIAADVILKLLQVFTDESRRIRSTFRGYLSSVVRNRIFDHFRELRKENELRISIAQFTGEDDQTSFDIETVSDALETSIVGRLRLLEIAMKSVSERVGQRQWDMFREFELEGAAAEEIATKFGLSLSAVYKNRTLVRKLLTSTLEDLENAG